jgi:hypothetical protein
LNSYRPDPHSSDARCAIDSDRWSDDGGPISTVSTQASIVAFPLKLANHDWAGALVAEAARAEGARYCYSTR